MPVRVNLTSIVSPETESTVPGPKVLWETLSPAEKDVEGAGRAGAAARGAEKDDALGATPVERVREPKTLPP